MPTEASECPPGPIKTYKVPPPGAGSPGGVPPCDLGSYYPGPETAGVPDTNFGPAGKETNGTFTHYLDEPETKTKLRDANTGAPIAFTNTV